MRYHDPYKMLWCHNWYIVKNFFLNIVIWKVFQGWSFFNERSWSENHTWKKYLIFSLILWYEKIWSKEPLHNIAYNDFIIIQRSLLRTVETKPVSLYKTSNLLYETKVIGVTKLFKSYVKTKGFSMGYCKHEAEDLYY